MKIIYENIYVKYVRTDKTGTPTRRLVTLPNQGFTCNFVDCDPTTKGLVDNQYYICTVQPKEGETYLKHPRFELISELTPTNQPSLEDILAIKNRIEAQYDPSVAE